MTAQLPSGTNTFVKNHEATGNMVVDFSRNPASFGLAEYCQIVPVKKKAGYYLEMTVEEAGRVLNSDAAEYLWPDGADAPDGSDGTEAFEYKQFLTDRRAYPFRLGSQTVDQADWDIKAQHLRIHGQKAMTARTMAAVTALTTSGNYAASHTSDTASITGASGNWLASTAARQDIKRSLDYAAEQIMLDTLSAIDPEDLMLVLSPGLARQLALTAEIVDMIKQSPDAKHYVSGEGKFSNANAKFGLPPTIHGYKVVVEKTAKTTSRKGATAARSFVMGDSSAAMCARPGGLEGQEGAPSFSTLTCFMLEEFSVETKEDVDNRRVTGRVVEDWDMVMTAPVSGFLFTTTGG